MSTHLLPRPKSYADAQESFLFAMGDPRRLNKYMAVAFIVLAATCVGLVMLTFRTIAQQHERIVVRIDDVGRAQAVGFTSLGYKVQPTEIKYFLAQFVTAYYGRNRATIREDFQRSIMFLSEQLAAARMAEERKSKTLEKFTFDGSDEVAVQVTNIVLGDLTGPKYSAQVDIDKVFRDRAGNETKREKFVVSIAFTTTAEVSNSAILVNPLGFVIVSLRADQAFEKQE